MKFGTKLLATAAAVGFGFTVSQSVRAALLAADTFTYPNGNLAGNNGGTGFTTAWGDAGGNTATTGTAAVQVSGNQVLYNGAGAGNQLVFRSLPFSFGGTGITWAGLDYTQAAGATNFGGVQLFNNGSEKVLVGAASQGTVWTLGRDGGAAAVGSTVQATSLKTGVVRFTLGATNTGSADLWVGTGVGTVDVNRTPDATITGLTLTGVNTVRVGSSSAQTIDNLKFGDTAADVGGVPEPTSLGLLGLGGLGLLARRRRA